MAPVQDPNPPSPRESLDAEFPNEKVEVNESAQESNIDPENDDEETDVDENEDN